MGGVVQMVARNLRRLRVERGVSLSELSRLSGVGKATLSGLEGGGGNPTIETLWSLADALGVAFGELVAEPEPPPRVQVRRAADGAQVPGAGAGVRLVERLVGRNVVELYEFRLEPEGVREARPHSPGVLERVFVTEGVMLAGPRGEAVELSVGDSVRFPGDGPHSYAAGLGGARALVLLEYPQVGYSEVGYGRAFNEETREVFGGESCR